MSKKKANITLNESDLIGMNTLIYYMRYIMLPHVKTMDERKWKDIYLAIDNLENVIATSTDYLGNPNLARTIYNINE